MSDLNTVDRNRGRRLLLVFTFFNSFSFLLVTGNIISLYLLRLGATATQIGVVAALPFVSFFFLLLGRILVPYIGVVRLFGFAWLLRYVVFAPILLAPLAFARSGSYGAFVVVALTAFGFNIARGIGIVANAPLFGGYSTPRDRGSLISVVQVITGVISIVTGLATAALLGPEAPVARYTLFLATGITSGLVAAVIAHFLPELSSADRQARSPFFQSVARALANRDLRRFVLVFALVSFCSGVGRTYFVLYAKVVYEQSDRAVLLYTTAGSVGTIVAGFMGGLLLDRMGAKPQIQIALVAQILTCAVAIWAPAGTAVVTVALLVPLFFVGMVAVLGGEIASQSYFYGITPEGERLNLGILYFVILGIGGAVGAYLGGVLVDQVGAAGFDPIVQYRTLFALTLVVAAAGLLGASHLQPLGAWSLSSTLGVMFSLRDLHAAGLLNRLAKAQSAVEERDTLREIASSRSRLPEDEILARLDAPGYIVRGEALEALTALPFTRRIEDALVEHLERYEYTTAATAAQKLGRRKSIRAIPALRRAARSDDYWLRAKALTALARCRDRASLPVIIKTIETEANPTVLIHAGAAVRLAHISEAVPAVLARLAAADVPTIVLDELIATMVEMEEIGEWFYAAYNDFVRGGERARVVLDRELTLPVESAPLCDAAELIEDDPSRTYALMRSVLNIPFPFDSARAVPRVAFFLVTLALTRRSR